MANRVTSKRAATAKVMTAKKKVPTTRTAAKGHVTTAKKAPKKADILELFVRTYSYPLLEKPGRSGSLHL